MKNKRLVKNLLLIFSLISYIAFFIVEQMHDCDGDGCLICVASTIVRFISNVLLLVLFIPLVIEKVVMLVKTNSSVIAGKTFKEVKNKINCNFSYNSEVNLNVFCVALK